MSDSKRFRGLPVFAAILAGVACVLNWLWEMAQMPAYAELAGRTWAETLAPCTAAAVGDVALTFAAYGIGALAAGRLYWGEDGRWSSLLAAAILGAAFAVAVEWRALAVGRWSYTGRMPVVPLLGAGLWPILQLAVLTPVSIRLAWWLASRLRAMR